MNAEFSSAKNGEATCSYGGKYLHSKYNPSAEAQKFVENITTDFEPLAVIVIEASISYCTRFLRERFKNAVLCTVRFSNDFKKYDENWDFVFYPQGNSNFFQEDLFNALGEEKLCSALVVDWPASKNVFPQENAGIWLDIRQAILKARDVLVTRAYFSKRWLKNSLIFASRIKNPALLKKNNLSVVIAASGPSLKNSIPFLKKFRKSFFLIAVSSAYAPLHKNNIYADIVISTDGGYWAKKHLLLPGLCDSKTVFALGCESAIPKSIFETNKIIPICYEDGLEQYFMKAAGCPFMTGRRNGTVSGTALEFALELTSSNIYLCGLDQESAEGFQHTQPNSLELSNERLDNRLKTKETRCASSQFSSEKSLEIYRNWFSSRPKEIAGRVFRVSDNHKYNHTLGNIKDVNWSFFEKLMSKNEEKICIENVSFSQKADKKQILLEKLNDISSSDFFRNELFPLESLLIKREENPEKRKKLEIELEKKVSDFIKKMDSIL